MALEAASQHRSSKVVVLQGTSVVPTIGDRRIRDVVNTEIPGRWLKPSGLNLVQIMLENRILMQILKYYLDARYFLVSHYPVTIMDI